MSISNKIVYKQLVKIYKKDGHVWKRMVEKEPNKQEENLRNLNESEGKNFLTYANFVQFFLNFSNMQILAKKFVHSDYQTISSLKRESPINPRFIFYMQRRRSFKEHFKRQRNSVKI